MGARGPLRRDRNGRAAPRGTNIVQLTPVAGGLVQLPSCPDEYLAEVKAAWADYAKSEVAGALVDVDVPDVDAYFFAMDQYLRNRRIAAATPYTTGSQDQVVAHPAVAVARDYLKQMVDLGQKLGISPMARQRLGIAAGKAALTAAEVNRMAQESTSKPAPRRGGIARNPRVIDGEWEAVE